MSGAARQAQFSKKQQVARLIRSHWKGLAVALIAVLGETLADVLEPWPVKVVVDNILQSKKLPPWLGGFVSGLFGQNKLAILNFAVAAVAAIAMEPTMTMVECPSENIRPTDTGRFPSCISLRVTLSMAAIWSASTAWRRPKL